MTELRPSALSARDKVIGVFARLLMSLMSRPNRLAILIYHRVLDAADPLQPMEIDCATFDLHMEIIARIARPIALSEAVERQRSNSLERRSVCVTFDDGYADNLQNAAPILNKWNVPATVFVTETYLDGGIMWSDAIVESIRVLPVGEYDLGRLDLGRRVIDDNRTRARLIDDAQNAVKYLPSERRDIEVAELANLAKSSLPGNLMLRRQDLTRLRERNIEIGAHTLSHPILSKVSDVDAEREIVESKARLEALCGTAVDAFAYPNGRPGKDYERRHVAMVKRAGFKLAVSTAPGVARPDRDVYQMPRLGFGPMNPTGFMLRLAAAYKDTPAAEV